MPSWINHAVLIKSTGSNVNANYAFGFAPLVGSLLVVFATGPVTWTTPSGWTLQKVQLDDAGAYLFSKVAGSGDSSLTATHNGTGQAQFPTVIEVWEFPAGSTVQAVASQKLGLGADSMPALSGLVGTNSIFWAGMTLIGGNVDPASYTLTFSESTPVGLAKAQGTSDGFIMASAVTDGFTNSATGGSYNLTGPAAFAGEKMSWAVKVAAPVTALVTNAGPDQAGIEPGAIVTLSATDTPGQNPITSSSWAWVSGGTAPALSGTNPVMFVAPASLAGVTVVMVRSISDGSASASDTVAVQVLPSRVRVVDASGTIRPALTKVI